MRVGMRLRGWQSSPFKGFIYLLVFDKTFRNLFYYRIGKAKYLMSYLLLPHPCFTLATDMKIGKGFQCVHPFASIVNAESIGCNFSIKQCVTVGNKGGGRIDPR